jgi:hypothetical protein
LASASAIAIIPSHKIDIWRERGEKRGEGKEERKGRGINTRDKIINVTITYYVRTITKNL